MKSAILLVCGVVAMAIGCNARTRSPLEITLHVVEVDPADLVMSRVRVVFHNNSDMPINLDDVELWPLSFLDIQEMDGVPVPKLIPSPPRPPKQSDVIELLPGEDRTIEFKLRQITPFKLEKPPYRVQARYTALKDYPESFKMWKGTLTSNVLVIGAK